MVVPAPRTAPRSGGLCLRAPGAAEPTAAGGGGGLFGGGGFWALLPTGGPRPPVAFPPPHRDWRSRLRPVPPCATRPLIQPVPRGDNLTSAELESRRQAVVKRRRLPQHHLSRRALRAHQLPGRATVPLQPLALGIRPPPSRRRRMFDSRSDVATVAVPPRPWASATPPTTAVNRRRSITCSTTGPGGCPSGFPVEGHRVATWRHSRRCRR